MTTQNPELPVSIEEREFSTSRKGYDKREVRAFLSELESNFRDLEDWAQDAKLRLQQAEFEAQQVKDKQGESVDGAIAAVLESKDRILDRARKQAAQIEAEAQERADAVLEGVGVSVVDLPEDIDEAQREAAEIIEMMIQERWLESYRSLEGVDYTLKRVSRRSEILHPIFEAADDLEDHLQEMEGHFLSFYPDLIQHVADARSRTD